MVDFYTSFVKLLCNLFAWDMSCGIHNFHLSMDKNLMMLYSFAAGEIQAKKAHLDAFVFLGAAGGQATNYWYFRHTLWIRFAVEVVLIHATTNVRTNCSLLKAKFCIQERFRKPVNCYSILQKISRFQSWQYANKWLRLNACCKYKAWQDTVTNICDWPSICIRTMDIVWKKFLKLFGVQIITYFTSWIRGCYL